MMSQDELILILGMAAVTFGVRYPVLALVGRVPLPERLFAALKYVPVAVLTAIIVPSVLMPDGKTLALTLENAYIVAAVVAVLVAWRTQSLLMTIIAGMGTLWLWQALV